MRQYIVTRGSYKADLEARIGEMIPYRGDPPVATEQLILGLGELVQKAQLRANCPYCARRLNGRPATCPGCGAPQERS